MSHKQQCGINQIARERKHTEWWNELVFNVKHRIVYVKSLPSSGLFYKHQPKFKSIKLANVFLSGFREGLRSSTVLRNLLSVLSSTWMENFNSFLILSLANNLYVFYHAQFHDQSLLKVFKFQIPLYFMEHNSMK